jgi:beta-phosphoglucomutase
MAKIKKAAANREVVQAILFDMDGVVADTLPSHIEAWVEFSKRHGVKVTRGTVLKHFNGRVNKEIFEFLFKRKLSSVELRRHAGEKESLYRNIYRSKVKLLAGLLPFLKELREAGVKVALATAGPPGNVALVLNGTKTKKYFNAIVNASNIKFGKPHPEIFLTAARRLKVKPSHCVVFEDAMFGIEAARRAGMKVVGVATSHKSAELKHADLVIKDFQGMTVGKLEELLRK